MTVITQEVQEARQEKAREARLRRLAAKYGLILRKSRAKNWSVDNQQGYALIDIYGGYNVANSARFDLTLDDVEEYFRED